MEEKVSKDVDREKKLQDELTLLKNNYEMQRQELDKLSRDKQFQMDEKEKKNSKMRDQE